MATQSMYSVSGLITRTRALLDEPNSSDTYHSDDEIIYWFNLAQIDIAQRYAVNPATFTVSGSSFDSNKEYTLPQDFITVEQVRKNHAQVGPMAFDPYDNGRGGAWGYYVRGPKLGIPAVQSGDSVQVWGRAQLAELTSGSTSSLPVYFSPVLIDYALARCAEKDQDGEKAQYWTGRYEQDLVKAARTLGALSVQIERPLDWA